MQTNRREFLGAAGALALAVTTPRHVRAVVAENGKKVRVGVVGGGFGAGFQFHEHPDCIVQAVSDLRADRRKNLMDVYRCSTSYDSLEELVKADDIDAVAVFTDGPLHVDHVAKVMRHGKHVLSAVPAAWATLEQAEELLDIVKTTGLNYMLAETSYWGQPTISAREFYRHGDFGTLFSSSSMYQHDGLESLFIRDGKKTWRYGMAPMHYPTHCTSHLIGVTGERLTEVVCHGWGDDNPVLKDNAYGNPFWNETAQFKTDRGNNFDCHVWWKGAHRGAERAEWIGTDMSFYGPTPNGLGPVIVRRDVQTEKDDGGFVRSLPKLETYEQTQHWKTEALPEPLRHPSGHDGSHTFITHEFIDSIVKQRQPEVDVYEALAYTVPGIVAHQSALKGGELLKIPSYDPSST
jgi:predicted dehydrogenase